MKTFLEQKKKPEIKQLENKKNSPMLPSKKRKMTVPIAGQLTRISAYTRDGVVSCRGSLTLGLAPKCA